MRTTKRTFIFLLLAVIMFVATPVVLEARTSATATGGDFFDTLLADYGNPSFSGTKMNATLAVYYQLKNSGDPSCPGQTELVDMLYSLRLDKGGVIHNYSGSNPDICYQSLKKQAELIEDFISRVVIPDIAYDGAPWKLKSIQDNKDCDSLEMDFCSSFFMDFQIAVKE
jgi:hypothetical protein